MASRWAIRASEARYRRIGPSLRSPRTQGAAFAQPAPGGALGAGPGHARDDRAEGGGAYRGTDTQLFEHGGQ